MADMFPGIQSLTEGREREGGRRRERGGERGGREGERERRERGREGEREERERGEGGREILIDLYSLWGGVTVYS